MRVLVAFDKFKDALSAQDACAIATATLQAGHPEWTIDSCPLTDGGEGFCATLAAAAGVPLHTATVTGPRGAPVAAPFALVPGERLPAAVATQLALPAGALLGVVGMAEASGLALLAPEERDPWRTTTGGTGELLRATVAAGATALLLGLGGSATNDLGLGALAALGLEARRANGAPVSPPTPDTWPEIERLHGRVALPPLCIACDVTNPLLGPRGATATFGPQKGLRAADVRRFEAQMARLALLLCHHGRQADTLMDLPGTGAAGGIGFGLMAAAGARLVPGFDLVSAWLDLPARLARADAVLTGEGRFDATSLGGKGPGGVAAAARRQGKTVRVLAGSLGVPADEEHRAITPPDLPLPEALRRAPELLAAAVRSAL